MAKMRVGIVFGGKSAEHEVSLQSAKNIVEAIDKSRFDVVLLGIDKQGLWHINDAGNYLLNAQDPARIALRPSTVTLAQIPGREAQQLINAESGQPLAAIDVIFPIVHGTLGEDGLVPLDFLRGLLELDEIVVGSAFVNIARPGQKPVLVRAWANHAAFIYRNLLADTQGGVTFGFTAQFGSRVSGSIPDPDMGMRGGQRVRVGESVRELIVAQDCGYFFQNAVSA